MSKNNIIIISDASSILINTTKCLVTSYCKSLFLTLAFASRVATFAS